MKEYIVKKGFMAHQFGDRPKYSIGIEANAIAKHFIYKCIVGKEKKEIAVSVNDIDKLIKKYGKSKVVRKMKGKDVYIVPLEDL